MKKIVSLLLVFIVCISSFPLLAFAQGGPGEYTDTETETIYSRYVYNESMLDAIFGDDTAVGYWNVVNDTEEKGFLKWLIDASSWIIGEYPDKQDYAEILANLIMMQSGDLAEQVQNQSQYDDLKDGMDYAIDIVDIASDFVGGANLLEEISPIIDAATGGADVIIDNIEQAKYYEITIRDYTQSKLFLDAISNYAENEELRATASTLLEANDKLLESRLEYLADSSATLADYQAEFFVKNMSFGLLKTADLYKADETVKWYVDGGEKISKSIQSIFSGASFAFRMTMLAGDIGFGTSDTFNRYQEMKTVSDIAGAIVEANHHVQTPSRYDSPDALNIIQTKCDYYKMLIATHARGEYLVYQLLINDAGLLSDFRALFDAFKDPGETTESWYNGQINVMLEYFDILNNMFVIEEENKTTTDLGDVPQDAAEFNGHYYYVYDIDTVATWEDAKEYCESQGGYLATITSQEEDEFLYSYITDMGYNSVLFGLSDTDQDNVWTWVTGEPFSYENWASGEPNRQGGYEHYGMYYEKNKNGTWNDGSGKTCPFLCEWSEYQATDKANIDIINSAESALQDFTLTENGSLTNISSERGSESLINWSSTYNVVGYKSDSLNASSKISLTDTTSGVNNYTNEPYSNSRNYLYSKHYKDGILSCDISSLSSLPFIDTEMSPIDFMNLCLPDSKCILDIKENSDSNGNKIFTIALQADAITSANANILGHLIDSLSGMQCYINWTDDPEYGVDGGFDEISMTVTLDHDNRLKSIVIESIVNVVIQDYFKAKCTLEYNFNYDVPNDNIAMSEQEIYEKLVSHYKKGTEDSDGSDLAVMQGSIQDSIYSTMVRCGMPGNPSASQPLYDVQVDIYTGDVTQIRILTDNKVTKFNIKQ